MGPAGLPGGARSAALDGPAALAASRIARQPFVSRGSGARRRPASATPEADHRRHAGLGRTGRPRGAAGRRGRPGPNACRHVLGEGSGAAAALAWRGWLSEIPPPWRRCSTAWRDGTTCSTRSSPRAGPAAGGGHPPRWGMEEMPRVLRPDGTALVLEFVRPSPGPTGRLYRTYLVHVLPRVGGLIRGQPAAYRYLSSTFDSYRMPDELV